MAIIPNALILKKLKKMNIKLKINSGWSVMAQDGCKSLQVIWLISDENKFVIEWDNGTVNTYTEKEIEENFKLIKPI